MAGKAHMNIEKPAFAFSDNPVKIVETINEDKRENTYIIKTFNIMVIAFITYQGNGFVNFGIRWSDDQPINKRLAKMPYAINSQAGLYFVPIVFVILLPFVEKGK